MKQEDATVENNPKNLSDAIERLEKTFSRVSDSIGEEAKKAKGKIEEQVTENPWAAIGVAGLIFFILGFLFGWKSSRRSD